MVITVPLGLAFNISKSDTKELHVYMPGREKEVYAKVNTWDTMKTIRFPSDGPQRISLNGLIKDLWRTTLSMLFSVR